MQRLILSLMSHRWLGLLTLGVAVAVAAALTSVKESEPHRVTAADRDTGSMTIGMTSSLSTTLEATGIGQSLVAPSPSGSPACDSGQYIAINSVQLALQITDGSSCFRHFTEVFVQVRTSRDGAALAEARVYAKYPMGGLDMLTAEFERPPLVRPGTTYYLVVSYQPFNVDSWYRDHWTRHDAEVAGEPTAAIGSIPDGRYYGKDASGTPCTAPPGLPTVILGLDENDPYALGSSDTGPDIVATVNYSFVIEDRVLVLYLDPIIGEVNYSDSIGSIATHDYEGARLSEILEGAGWHSPKVTAGQLARSIEDVSGGMVRMTLEEHTLDEWPLHLEGAARWWDDVGMLGSIDPFTQWTDDTWPCYPNIPEKEILTPQTRFRRSCYPEVSSGFDYEDLFSHVIRDDKTLLELVNEQQVDEIWIAADPTSGLLRSVLAVPVGDDGFDIGSPPVEIGDLEYRVPVMALVPDEDFQTTLAAYAMRAEKTIAAVFNGNLYPSCAVNALETNTYNQFTRIYGCQILFSPSTAVPGSVGRVFAPPNTSLDDTAFYAGVGKEYAWETPAPNDADKWLTYPDLPTPPVTQEMPCEEWGCTYLGYLQWWLQHVPANVGDEDGIYNNLWPYIVQPSCFPDLEPARYDPTPAPTPTP